MEIVITSRFHVYSADGLGRHTLLFREADALPLAVLAFAWTTQRRTSIGTATL